MSRLVKVLQVGYMDYGKSLKLQKLLANLHFKALNCETQETCNVLMLVEHEPVYTIGIRDKSYTSEDEEKLKSLGASFYRTNRGGLITFHGPGQLVAYPIIDLKQFKPSMKWYVGCIENTIIDLCGKYGITAETSPHTGVWVKDKKICAIGIHGSRYITTHGLALNCNTDLDWFQHIVPCGIENKGVTSLTEQLCRKIGIEEVVPSFLLSFSKIFDCSLIDFPVEAKYDLLKEI